VPMRRCLQVPHDFWLRNAIRRNPRTAGLGKDVTKLNAEPAVAAAVPKRIVPPIRRQFPYWDMVARPAAMRWLEQNGFPQSGDGGQAALERYIADRVAAKTGCYPSPSSIRIHVRGYIGEYRAALTTPSKIRTKP
jgi:hypothetical protein